MSIPTASIMSRLKSASPWTLTLGGFLLILFLFLSIRATDEYRWSDWGFGDAQTMLSLRQWEEGGWLHNYLLFKPQGYAKVVDLFDDPELRQHAHGTCPGSSPRVGPRLWYTHYPAGYLVPYALMFKVGLDSLFSVRMLSILFSLGALALMYLVFARITSPRISFLAVLFYGLSSPFLGYADSLANQPIDDLLRFGFMFAVVMASRAHDGKQQRWLIAAWIMEFLLSLTSFDSVFFVYAWLIGWDLVEQRGFRWKLYLLFAVAPVSAHGLQFLQNVWYLGWQDAFIDIKDAFLIKNAANDSYNMGEGRMQVLAVSLLIVFDNLLRPVWLLTPVALLYGVFDRRLRGEDRDFPSLKLLGVLFLSGLAFVLVLPHAARMPYEARQMIPFAALLVSGFTWTLPYLFRRAVHNEQAQGVSSDSPRLRVAVPYLFATMILLLIVWYRFAISDRTPVYELGPRKEEMKFAEKLKLLPTRYEPVYFDMGGFSIYWDPNYVPGYPQILPLTEYYAGSRPILCFREPEMVAKDIINILRKSNYRFSPVLVSNDPQQIEKVLDVLDGAGVLTSRPQIVQSAMGRLAMDITDYIKGSSHEAGPYSRKP